MSRSRLATVVPWLAACVLLAAAAHQAAVALGWLAIGPLPGEQAPGQPYILGAALLVLVVLGFALQAIAPFGRRVAAAPLIAIACALLVVTRFYGFDPYYAPTLRRMSDGGLLPGAWIVVVVACALGAALVAARWNRVGAVAVAAVCWLAFFRTGLLAGAGH